MENGPVSARTAFRGAINGSDMRSLRGAIDADTLLKVVLVLVVVWLGLEVVEQVVEVSMAILDPIRPLIGVLVVVLIVLWLLDEL